jgi:hypothetical protein
LRTSDVLDEFLALLPRGSAAPTKAARQRQLNALAREHGEARFNAILKKMDRRFYGSEDELRERLYAYVVANGLDAS